MRVDSRTELVVAADIAERLGISRARVSVLASRSGFPRPVGRLGRSEVWRWASVERWARERGAVKLRVGSRTTREGAHRFYEREGYALAKTSHWFQKDLA